MKKLLKKILKKPSVYGGVQTDEEYDVDAIIKLELETVIKEKTNELSKKYYRKIKTNFCLEIE